MNVWRLILPRSNPAASVRWAREHGRIAIGGGGIGDISGRGTKSRREIKAALEAAACGACSRGWKSATW